MIRESGPPFDPEAITCPVVIGKGTRSPRHLRYASDIMAARIPQSHLVVIPDVGHAAHSAKPEQFTQLVLHAAALTNR